MKLKDILKEITVKDPSRIDLHTGGLYHIKHPMYDLWITDSISSKLAVYQLTSSTTNNITKQLLFEYDEDINSRGSIPVIKADKVYLHVPTNFYIPLGQERGRLRKYNG